MNMSWVEPRMEMAKDFTSYKASSNLFSEQGPVRSPSRMPSDLNL